MGVDAKGIGLGKLLHVGCHVRRYNGKVQLNVWFLTPEHSVDGLSLFWLQVSTLQALLALLCFPLRCLQD